MYHAWHFAFKLQDAVKKIRLTLNNVPRKCFGSGTLANWQPALALLGQPAEQSPGPGCQESMPVNKPLSQHNLRLDNMLTHIILIITYSAHGRLGRGPHTQKLHFKTGVRDQYVHKFKKQFWPLAGVRPVKHQAVVHPTP